MQKACLAFWGATPSYKAGSRTEQVKKTAFHIKSKHCGPHDDLFREDHVVIWVKGMDVHRV